jgi:hypothetical protein
MFVSGCSFSLVFSVYFCSAAFTLLTGGCEALEELLEFAKLSKA